MINAESEFTHKILIKHIAMARGEAWVRKSGFRRDPSMNNSTKRMSLPNCTSL